MDEQGLDYALVMPTLVSLIEERMHDDPDLCADVIHAFNQWMVEEWPFVYERRIYACPYITPVLVDRAVEELDWLVEHGARSVLMRPAPAWGYTRSRWRRFPEFDPFWKRMEETGTIAVFHVSDSGYDRYYSEWPGGQHEMAHFGQRGTVQADGAVQPPPDRGHRLVADLPWGTVAIPRAPHPARRERRVVGAVLPRPHGSRVLAVASGVRLKPSDTFNRNIWVQVNHEEDPRELIARSARTGCSSSSGPSPCRGACRPALVSRGGLRPDSRTTRTSARSWVAT